MTQTGPVKPNQPLTLDDVLFVGFNSRVAAMAKSTGEILWEWKASQGSGYVSLLLDGDRLFASIQGYMYCLDATDGHELWFNPMKGFGTGVTSLASSTVAGGNYGLMAEAQAEAARSSSSTPVPS